MNTNLPAASVPLTLGGVTYELTPLADRDYMQMDQWLRSQVIRTARASLDENSTEADRDMTMRAAHDFAATLSITTEAGARQLATPSGLSYFIWLGVRKNHPDVTPDQIRQWLLSPRAIDEALDSVELATGQGQRKKATGRRPSRRQPKKR